MSGEERIFERPNQIHPANMKADSSAESILFPSQRKTKNKFSRAFILRHVRGIFGKKSLKESTTEAVLELLQPTRYKPDNLEQMSLETKFSKEEVKFLYRAFKTECPNGIIDEETFKEVYEKIFPMGDASKYAQIVFRAIDRDKTGGITFGDFMDFISMISKGSDQEKLLWSFQFFDVNQDGKITREEMIKVSESVFELMGANLYEKGNLKFVEEVFQEMNSTGDGQVTLQEFVMYCRKTKRIFYSLPFLP